jgi:hypothetical protein
MTNAVYYTALFDRGYIWGYFLTRNLYNTHSNRLINHFESLAVLNSLIQRGLSNGFALLGVSCCRLYGVVEKTERAEKQLDFLTIAIMGLPCLLFQGAGAMLWM